MNFSNDEDMLLVKIYGRNTEKIINRDSEIRNLVKLHKCLARCLGSPPVFARFDNGLYYSFAKGRPLQLHEMSNLVMARRIAKEKARMHAIPLSDEDIKKPLLYNDFFSKKYLKLWTLGRGQQGVCVCAYVQVCVCVYVHMS